uniref:Uncharacterized protein n=1 Tax=Fundulus heteroclitus TaxID=8078 RepID=A0A3Q2PDR0_FUNHE
CLCEATSTEPAEASFHLSQGSEPGSGSAVDSISQFCSEQEQETLERLSGSVRTSWRCSTNRRFIPDLTTGFC